MFNKKITKLTSGAAILGVAPTLALQAQGGVDAASKEVAKRFLQENSGSSVNFKEFGIKFIIMLLVTCVGWYAACVIFNKLALEKLRGDISLVGKIVEQKENLEKDIKALDEKISAYKNVNHDTKIDDKDPLKELKSDIRNRKAKIEENKKSGFEKVKKEYNRFHAVEKVKMEKLASKSSDQWEKYEDKNNKVERIKKIQDDLRKFENTADLLVEAQNVKAKYEKIKKDYEEKKQLIEKDKQVDFSTTFEKEKKSFVAFLKDVLNNRKDLYQKFTFAFCDEDKEEIGEDMVDLENAINFIESYEINASEESFEKLSKYKDGISEQLKCKDCEKNYRGFCWQSNRYLENVREQTVDVKRVSPLMKVDEEYKNDIVAILQKIEEYLNTIIDCQKNSAKVNEYKKTINELAEEKVRLERESTNLQKKCEDKKADWESFEQKIGEASKELKSNESKIGKKMIENSGLNNYFAQFEELGKIDKPISIRKVFDKIDNLDREVQNLKPEKTEEQLEKEISDKCEIWAENLEKARKLSQEAKNSEEKLARELKELKDLKERKEQELSKLRGAGEDLRKLKEKEKGISERFYKFNINPMKYYNEVKEFLAGEIENRNV